MAQRANNRRQHTGPERSDPNAKIDLILVAAISIGLTLTSLTSEGSQSEYYQLPGWLVAVQPISRPGAIAMFLIALVRYFQLRGVFSLSHLAGPAWVAWIINLFLTTKVFILGDDFDFYAQALAVSVIQIFLFVICVGGEQKRRGNPSLDSSLLTNFEASIFVFSGLFAAVNLILLVVAPQAVSTWFGRFYGTTANPQHTMMLSVMCIPICALVLRGARRPAVQRAAALAVLIGLCTVVYVTGSRSGFCDCACSVELLLCRPFYRAKICRFIVRYTDDWNAVPDPVWRAALGPRFHQCARSIYYRSRGHAYICLGARI